MVSMARILVHAIFPFELPGLPKMTQWWVPPSLEDDEHTKEKQKTAPGILSFYEIAIVKQTIRLGLHMCYIFLISWVSMETIYKTDHDAHLVNATHLERPNLYLMEIR